MHSTLSGTELPLLHTEVPGPESQAWVDRLAVRECPGVTARRARRAASLGVAADDPIVWARARGACVEDVDGNRFVDMTAGFGVASVGHAHPAVVGAMRAQSHDLLHAMGDAFPDRRRIELGALSYSCIIVCHNRPARCLHSLFQVFRPGRCVSFVRLLLSNRRCGPAVS